jgi:alpha-L-rhamnosidase
MRRAINDRMWDPQKGAYRDGLNADGTPVDHWAVHATAFATAFGVPADPQQAARAADYLQTRGMVCSVYCAAFLVPALYHGDRGDVGFDLLTSTGLRSWLNMIAQGAGATMEAWDLSLKSNTTYSHPWAASPAYIVPRDLFGIEATTPGFATFKVRPQTDGLQWAHITVPTRFGSVGAAVVDRGDRTDVGVHVPSGTTASVYVPAPATATDRVYVDGAPRTAVAENGFLRVDGVGFGCHVLSTEAGSAPLTDAQLFAACPDGSPWQVLGERIDALVAEGRLAAHVAASLRDRFDRALRFAQEGREAPAIAMLEQFIARARNQVKGDADDIAVRGALVASAQSLIDALRIADDGESAPN